ncbi:MAG: hypothetical protein ACI9CF_001468 [Candidatus Omnitrophota bacterium]|jgi:hypothetical protein
MKSKKKLLIGVFLLGIIISLIFYAVLSFQSAQLGPKFIDYVTARFQDEFGLKLTVGSVEGDLFGTMAARDIKAIVSSSPDQEVLFEAAEIRFKYTLADLFKRNFSSWFDIILKKPVFYVDVSFNKPNSIKSSYPRIGFVSAVANQVRKNARLLIEGGQVVWTESEGMISGVEGLFTNKSFELQLSISHYPLGPFDVTSILNLKGDLGQSESGHLYLKGSISTQGSVVNWKPIPEESLFLYKLSEDKFDILTGSQLMGFDIEGLIGHSQRQDVELEITATDYPFRSMHDIFSFKGTKPLGATADFKINIQGSLAQPRVFGEMLVLNEEENIEAPFKNMQMKFDGIFPEVQVSESRMFLHDGSVMRFSDQHIQLTELFNRKTYKHMIQHTEQTNVQLGDWTLRRTEKEDSVSLRRQINDRFSVSYDRNVSDETRRETMGNENEVALEYQLGGAESVRMELKDDESFWGIQRKNSF